MPKEEILSLTQFSSQEFTEFLLSHKETTLILRIDIKNQDLTLLKIFEAELGKLTHLKTLYLVVEKQCILTVEGYTYIANALRNLPDLSVLSVCIKKQCFLQDEGLTTLKNAINSLRSLTLLKFKVNINNYISGEAGRDFIDSLKCFENLTTLYIELEDVQKSSTDEGNIHFWNGIQNLTNLESLDISMNLNDYGEEDLIELFQHMISLKLLRRLFLRLEDILFQSRLLEKIITFIGRMTELKSLKIETFFNRIFFNQLQRKQMIENLSNLKELEVLQLGQIENYLLEHSFEDYINFIGTLQNLKRFSCLNSLVDKQLDRSKSMMIISMISNLKQLKTLNLILNTQKGCMNSQVLSQISTSLSQMQQLKNISLDGKGIVKQFQQSKKDLMVLLHNIRHLTLLKHLSIKLQDSEFEEEIIYDSLLHLINLKCLKLKLITENLPTRGLSNINKLSQALMSLTHLQELSYSLYIFNLQSMKLVETIRMPFQYLINLENLSIELNIRVKSEEIQSISFFGNLKNLKQLKITYTYIPINIFDTTEPLSKLSDVKIRFKEKLPNSAQLNQILESLSTMSSNIVDLGIEAQLKDSSTFQEQFTLVCSKFKNLKNINLTFDRMSSFLSFYVKGFSQIPKLKSLELNCTGVYIDENPKLGEALSNIKNLERLIIDYPQNKLSGSLYIHRITHDLKPLIRFRETKITIKQKNNKQNPVLENNLIAFETKNDKFSKETNQIQNEVMTENVDEIQIENVDEIQIENVDEDKKKNVQEQYRSHPKNIYLIELKTTLYSLQNHLFEKNEFGLCQLKYLNSLELIDRYCEKELILTQQSFEFSHLNMLNNLVLDLKGLILSIDQIYLFSMSFKHLINLEFVHLKVGPFQEHYQVICHSMRQLINLKQLILETDINDSSAVSLGDSLSMLNKLQICRLLFSKKSTLDVKGVISITNGLKQNKNLKSLRLDAHTFLKQDININNDEQQFTICDCLQNMKHLVTFHLRSNTLQVSQLRDFISSIGSLTYLSILCLKMKESNPFNQETIDELGYAIGKLQSLSTSVISVFTKNSSNIRINKQYADLFNKNSFEKKLYVKMKNQKVYIYQKKIQITLKSNTIDNFELAFLTEIKEDTHVTFDIHNGSIMNNIYTGKIKVMYLKLNSGMNEIDIIKVCEFISRIQSTFKLNMEIKLNDQLNIESILTKIALSLLQLKSLKNLFCQLSFANNQVDNESLILMVSLLKPLQKLQDFSLHTQDQKVTQRLNNLCKKSFNRLVNCRNYS